MNVELLGNMVKVVGGGTPSREVEKYYRGHIPWITVKDFGDELSIQDAQEHITEEAVKNSATNVIPPGNVILITRMAVGKVAMNQVAVAINQDLKALICKPGIDSKYLLFYMLNIQGYLESQASGATVKGITLDDFIELEIPLPPLPEQRRIAAILTRADRLRRLRRTALQLSDGYLQSVFMQLFGAFLSNSNTTRFEDVLEMPLQNGVFERNDKYGSGTPVIWVDNLYHTISIDTVNLRRVKLDAKTIKKYEVASGDLLFTRSSLVRDGIGQVNIVPKLTEQTTFECHTIRARVDHNIVNPYYILELYRSAFGKQEILRRSKTATMTTIGQEDLETLPCPIPPVSLQNRFSYIVQKQEWLRVQQREALRQAEHLFDTLLHKAFRGELSEEEVETAEAATPTIENHSHRTVEAAASLTQAQMLLE